jgi:hypothetical protein
MDNYRTYPAEVRKIGGPDRAGYVQIRIYKRQDDESKVKDDDLPWALPLQAATSAATGRLGGTPSGLRVGSRVLVAFEADDTELKHPIILGSYARAAPPSNPNKQQKDDKTGKTEVKPDVANGDSPTSVDKFPKNTRNPVLGGKPDTKEPKYAQTPVVTKNDGVDPHKKAREKFAPKADDKTTAGAKKGTKDLNAAINMTGAKASQILQNLVSAMALVSSLMSSTSSSGQQDTTTSNVLNDAMKYFANKYGFTYTIGVFEEALSGNNYLRLSLRNRGIVAEALANLMKEVSQYGEKDLPVTKPAVVTVEIKGMVPLPVYGVAPDLYVRQYYAEGNNPYPDFVTWKGPNGDFLYTVKLPEEPEYSSADEQIYDEAQSALVKLLEPHIRNKTLTAEILNNALNATIQNIENAGMNSSLGNNAAQKLMQLLPMLLGALATPISLMQGAHLPRSVLDQGSVNKSLEKYSKKMALVKKMTSDTKNAFDLPSGLSGLMGLAGGAAALGAITGALGGNLGGFVGGLSSFPGGIGALTGSMGGLGSMMSFSSISSLANISVLNNLNVTQMTSLAAATVALEKAKLDPRSIYLCQSLLARVV